MRLCHRHLFALKIRLLLAISFSAAIAPSECLFAADQNHVAQVRASKKCDAEALGIFTTSSGSAAQWFQSCKYARTGTATTYSLMKSSRINTGGIEGALQYSFFELTSDWRMTPARPLWILLGLIPGFALLYTIPVLRPSPGGAALWRVWDKDRARKDQGQDDPEPLVPQSYRAPLYGLFFSVLSAFQIGWKELSIGSWIARLNPYEYTLKATGWVRTVSGVQSLISVYLLALAVLTYFGRPFE
jgi:hypothetical protein